MTRQRSAVAMILTLLSGAVAGAIATLLFAPQSGDVLRAEIAHEFADGAKHASHMGKRLQNRTQKVVELAQHQVQHAVSGGRHPDVHAKKA